MKKEVFSADFRATTYLAVGHADDLILLIFPRPRGSKIKITIQGSKAWAERPILGAERRDEPAAETAPTWRRGVPQ
jgi:hypothetical protein